MARRFGTTAITDVSEVVNLYDLLRHVQKKIHFSAWIDSTAANPEDVHWEIIIQEVHTFFILTDALLLKRGGSKH